MPFGSRECGPVGIFPDGGLLLVESGPSSAPVTVWRMGLDGSSVRVATLPAPVGDVFVEGPTSFLTVATFERRIDRVDLATGAATLVLDLSRQPGSFTGVVALDDGSLVVTNGVGAWRVRDGDVRVALPTRPESWIASLVPMSQGAFAFVDETRDHVVRVGPDGRRDVLTRLPIGGSLGTTLASRGDELVVLQQKPDDGSAPRRFLLRFNGARLVESVSDRRALVYGNGDGFGVAALAGVAAERAWLGSDGALLMLEACSIRALVAPDSSRARIAFLPSSWRSFADGQLAFQAGGAGEWRLTVQRVRGPMLLTRTGTTSAGVGRIRLGHILAGGEYNVRLVLTSAAGGVARARARIVTLDRLTVAQARRVIADVVTGGDGDGGDGWETTVGRCSPRSASHVACRINWSSYHLDDSFRGTCRGWAHARIVLMASAWSTMRSSATLRERVPRHVNAVLFRSVTAGVRAPASRRDRRRVLVPVGYRRRLDRGPAPPRSALP